MKVNGLFMPWRSVPVRSVFNPWGGSKIATIYVMKHISDDMIREELRYMVSQNGREAVSELIKGIVIMNEYADIPIVITSIVTDNKGNRRAGSHGQGVSIDVIIIRSKYGMNTTDDYYSHLPTLRWIAMMSHYIHPSIAIGVEFDHLHLEIHGSMRYKSMSKQVLPIPSAHQLVTFLFGDVAKADTPHADVYLFYSHQTFYDKEVSLQKSYYRLPFGEGSLVKFY